MDGITDSMDMSLRKLREIVEDMGSQRVGHDLATEQQLKYKNKIHMYMLFTIDPLEI